MACCFDSAPFVRGTTLNYFLDDKITKAEILFPGVGCFLVAVCLGSSVHSSNTADNSAKLKGSLREGNIVKPKDIETGSNSAEKLKAGSADFLIELEKTRAIKACDYNLLLDDTSKHHFALYILLLKFCCSFLEKTL
ncbi:hypothetical protein KIW84_023806 [Lathyrus oleraceus]|uniref:Uncharacterized protein n=1 Tax=Pisum sativum TaxID=3888 RepID=A0A9D5BBM1_PEA|nr:hypothetical protein KIW84_023806 [Pisum sativum]